MEGSPLLHSRAPAHGLRPPQRSCYVLCVAVILPRRSCANTPCAWCGWWQVRGGVMVTLDTIQGLAKPFGDPRVAMATCPR